MKQAVAALLCLRTWRANLLILHGIISGLPNESSFSYCVFVILSAIMSTSRSKRGIGRQNTSLSSKASLWFLQRGTLNWRITVKVPERVRFRHENVQLSTNHSSSWKESWAVIGSVVYIFMPKSYTFRNFDGSEIPSYKSKHRKPRGLKSYQRLTHTTAPFFQL